MGYGKGLQALGVLLRDKSAFVEGEGSFQDFPVPGRVEPRAGGLKPLAQGGVAPEIGRIVVARPQPVHAIPHGPVHHVGPEAAAAKGTIGGVEVLVRPEPVAAKDKGLLGVEQNGPGIYR